MKDVIRVEKKRILNQQVLIAIFILILGFSILSSILSLKNYNIYDSLGNVEIGLLSIKRTD